MFLKRSFNNPVPSLASLAASAVLNQPELALKSYKDKCIQNYPLEIGKFTRFDLNRLGEALQKLELPKGVLVFTTGSDGKFEKSCRTESPIELVVVCDPEVKDEVAKKITALVKSGLLPMDDRIEYKNPKSHSMITCDITKAVIPSRFLHKLALVGSDEQVDELTLKFVKDLQVMSGDDRRKFHKHFVQKHTGQMNKVIKGEDARDVDLAKGIISYTGMGRKATKYSLLRPIQYTLDLVMIDAIRSATESPDRYAQMLKNMPRGAPEQIDYMRGLGLLPGLSDEDVRDLKQAYTLGLFYFQTAQHLVSAGNRGQVQFQIPDRAELVKAYADAKRILEKIKSKK
ncbi:MAG: hypothetical protein JSS30_04630 [Verrucomicrobia bacterium]|nr:hypothetical protein [Verrucomicrobiota bacterium]